MVLNDPHVVIVSCSTIYRDVKVALLLLERVVLATMNRQREHTGVFLEDKSCAITLDKKQRIKTDSEFSNLWRRRIYVCGLVKPYCTKRELSRDLQRFQGCSFASRQDTNSYSGEKGVNTMGSSWRMTAVPLIRKGERGYKEKRSICSLE